MGGLLLGLFLLSRNRLTLPTTCHATNYSPKWKLLYFRYNDARAVSMRNFRCRVNWAGVHY
jgi:hypothetical protein